jgi:hypothetical protein
MMFNLWVPHSYRGPMLNEACCNLGSCDSSFDDGFRSGPESRLEFEDDLDLRP